MKTDIQIHRVEAETHVFEKFGRRKAHAFYENDGNVSIDLTRQNPTWTVSDRVHWNQVLESSEAGHL